MKPPHSDNLIYLDLEFISRKYEELFGLDPDTKVTRQQGASAGIKAYFANAGISTQESRTFSITSRQMLDKSWQHLNESYEQFTVFNNYTGTQVRWLKGELTLGEWRKADSNETGYEFYELVHDSQRTALLTEKSYLSAGFARILGASSALKGNISIPVRCLARVLWHVDDARNYVACPYVIAEET